MSGPQVSFALDLRYLAVALRAAPDGGIALRLDDGHRAVEIAIDGAERVETALDRALTLAERVEQVVALLRVRSGSWSPLPSPPEPPSGPLRLPSPNTGQPLT